MPMYIKDRNAPPPAVKPPTGTAAEAPGSTGFGLTPSNVDTFYSNPNNQNNQFFDSWAGPNGDAGARQAVWQQNQAQAQAASVQQQYRVQLLRNQAQQIAARYTESAKQLELSASTGGATPKGRQVASDYQIDYTTPQGRQQAQQTAARLRDLAQKSYVGPDGDLTGAANIVGFEKQRQAAAKSGAHADMQAAFAAQDHAQSITGRTQLALGHSLSKVAGLGAPIFNAATRGYAAANYAANHSDLPFWQRFGTALKAGIGRTVGSQYVAGGKDTASGEAFAATSDEAKIAELERTGQVDNFGNIITGHQTAAYTKNYGQGLWKAPEINLTDVASFGLGRLAALGLGGLGFQGAKNYVNEYLNRGPHLNPATPVNIAFQLGTDPTLAIGGELGRLGNLSERVGLAAEKEALTAGVLDEASKATFVRAVKVSYITDTNVGKSILEQSAKRLSAATGVDEAVRFIGKDTARSVVTDALKAGRTEGEAGVKKVLADAFADGKFHPQVGTVEHAARASGLYTGGVGFHPSQTLRDLIGKARSTEAISAPVEDSFTHRVGASVADYHAASGQAATTEDLGRALTPLEQASKDAADHVAGGASTSPTAANQELLRAGGHDVSETVTAFRGEPAHAREAARGAFFEAPTNGTAAEAARAEAMAVGHAGEHGIVWKVRVPQTLIDAGREEAAKTGEVGALLPKEWADAAYIHRAPTQAAQTEVLTKVREEARALVQSSGGLRAPIEAMNVDNVLDLSVSQAARLDGKWAGDLIANNASTVERDSAQRTIALVQAAEDMNTPGFAHAVEEALQPLQTSLHTNLSPGIQKLISDRLDKLETVLSILKGDAGADAQSIVRDQLERKYSLTGRSVVEEAAVAIKSRLGQQILKGKVYQEIDPAIVTMVLGDLPDGRVKDLITAELAAAKGKATYGQVAATIDRLVADPGIYEDVARRVELEGARTAMQGILRESALYDIVPFGSKMLSPLGVGAKAILSVMEKRPLSLLRTLSSPFTGTNEAAITDYFDRVGGLLDLSQLERQTMSDETQRVAALIARGSSPKLAEDLYSKFINLAFEKNGLPKELADDFAKSSIQAARSVQAFGMDDAGELVNKPFIETQAQTTFHMDPNEILVKLREEMARRGDHWAQVRVTFDKVTGTTVLGWGSKEYSIKGGAQALFKMWKTMITTRLYAPLIGLTAGVVDGINNGDDLWDSIQRGAAGALIGLGVGAAGTLRYMERNWIQARISSMLFHGPTAEESIPGLSRILSRFQEPVYQSGANALSNDLGEGFFINGGLSRTASRSWEALVRTPKNIKEFVESYSRIINFQVNPETDQMMMFFLQRKAGLIPPDVFAEQANAWLDTSAGKDWLNKMAGMGIKGRKNALSRYAEWTDRYVTKDVAALRLAPEAFGPGKAISEQQLRSLEDQLPQIIHSQVTDTVFKKGIGGFADIWKNAVSHAAYDAPALTGARRAFYNAEVARLEPRYIAAGMDSEAAQQVVGEIATRNTNAVMFRMENTSRFSSKADFISPFQGHREFNVKTWAKLAADRPGATVRYGVHAAQAFNAGVNTGIFQKDPVSGAWQMSVPGSGPLSRALFGVLPGLGDQKVNLSGFLAMTEGGLSPDGDTSNPWLNAATAAIPRPGGPFWSIAAGEFAKHFPSTVQDMPPGLRNLIFGAVGPSTRFLPADTDRLWQAIAGTAPPWNLLAQDEQKNDTAKYELEVGKQLIAEHRKADLAAGRPVDTAWVPTDNQVKDGVKNLFLAWGFMRGVLPASPHPVFRDETEANQLFAHYAMLQSRGSGLSPKDYQTKNYSQLRKDFVRDHPAFAPFFDATTKYVGPDTMRHWEHPFSGAKDATLEKQLGLRRELRWSEYKAVLKQQRDLGISMDSLRNAEATPGSKFEREAAMVAWRAANPGEAKYLRSKYFAEKELNTILTTYPDGAARQQALDRWRHMYAPTGQTSWSKSEYDKMVTDIRNKGSAVLNPWAEARDSETVYAAVQGQTGNIPSVDLRTFAYVRSHLSPAEQVRYWTQAVMHLSYTSGATSDPAKVTKAYQLYTTELRTLRTNNPFLQNYAKSDRSVARNQIAAADPYTQQVAAWHTGQASTAQALWSELRVAIDNEKRAYTSKQYSTGKMLKSRITELYAQIAATQNAAWSGSGIGMKDETAMHDSVRELTYFHDTGQLTDSQYQLKVQQANQADAFNVKFLPSNEEMHYLAMPTDVRAAYLDNLVKNLSVPPGESKARYAINGANPDKNIFATDYEGVPLKTYWQYLTNFQRDQLEKFMPRPVVDGWKAQDPSMEKGGGKGRGGGGVGLSGGNALNFAFSLMKQYDKRGGMAKPAAYAEYLALPNSPAVRNQFLDTHPDVASYVKAGPMSNMPPYYQMMVQQIMIRNGKWQGNELDATGMADLAFARTQLQVWNQRGGAKAPGTYDLWVNMPSGPDKAAYLNSHPEIGHWLQLGPMANMPEMYREVVRDIMLRYHEWTASTDGLGPVIQNYYRTPTFARSQYLLDHPELTAYWQATQSPEDRTMSDLTNQYYAIPDAGARGNFLSSHPELQQHLLDSRTRRYERFLNQVATYMGQQPQLFQHYLDDQTGILKDLLAKFAEPNLAKERHWMTPIKADLASTESGRARHK